MSPTSYQLLHPAMNGLVERVGFEPTKRNAADLQSAPFSHSGTSPFATKRIIQDYGDFVNSISENFSTLGPTCAQLRTRVA